MSTNEMGFLIATIILGGMMTFFGFVSKTQNAGDMINGFDNKKHDKAKVSKIIGKDFMIIGILILIIGVVALFEKDHLKEFSYIQTATMIIGIIKTSYSIKKHGKISK